MTAADMVDADADAGARADHHLVPRRVRDKLVQQRKDGDPAAVDEALAAEWRTDQVDGVALTEARRAIKLPDDAVTK